MNSFAAAVRTLRNHGDHILPGNRRIEKDSLTDLEAQLRDESRSANLKKSKENLYFFQSSYAFVGYSNTVLYGLI